MLVETIYCVLHLDKRHFEHSVSCLSLNIPQRSFLKPPFFIKLVYFIYFRCTCNKNSSCFKYPIKWHVYVFLKLVQSLGDWLVSVKMFIGPSSVKCCSFSDLWECWILFQQTLSPPNVPVFGIRNSFQTQKASMMGFLILHKAKLQFRATINKTDSNTFLIPTQTPPKGTTRVLIQPV